jgi:large subunit ribosomal protein L4
MAEFPLYGMRGEMVGSIEVSDDSFSSPVNKDVLYDVVLMYMARRRAGTASTKTRGEVRGGGRKPWRQKGTGRARHGSIRSPIWVGGGVVFGPKPRDYGYSVPKKVKRLAMKSAISAKMGDGAIVFVQSMDPELPKTKEMVRILEGFGIKDEKTLIVVKEAGRNLLLASRNLRNVRVVRSSDLNALDLLSADRIIMTVDAARDLEGRLSR